MKLIQKLREIWSIDELRQRILLTLGLIVVYRLGTYIALPGIDPTKLDQMSSNGSSGILGLVNLFAGGAFNRASIFALGIMPYISASIAIQLLTLAVPSFQKMQKEGESGRRKLNQWTRILTVVVTAAQGWGYAVYLRNTDGGAIVQSLPPVVFWASTLVTLTAGTLFVMWMGEKITDKGIGNGISLIIMVGILARFPIAIAQEFTARLAKGGLIAFVIEMAFLIVVIGACILLVQGTRRIPVQYAKRNIVQGGRMMQAGGVRQFLPLKLNAAGVMPIIFAQAIMFLPATIAQFASSGAQNSSILMALSDIKSGWYNLLNFLLIVAFTYFYTALIINPTQIADDLKRNSGFIPGIKPGKNTESFIDAVISRITLPGAIFLGIIAILPAIIMMFGVDQGFAMFFGGSSILIMVGVILDTLQTIETYLLNRHYDGLTSSGRIKGRQGNMYQTSM
ncbi:MAG: preprotein translocase subunit SecY [Bacteroidetes bacterium]|jgi:preprotein translocase subunit SecY|nr:preprotein translocase subunit SecY [Bacteroidota bacterium]